MVEVVVVILGFGKHLATWCEGALGRVGIVSLTAIHLHQIRLEDRYNDEPLEMDQLCLLNQVEEGKRWAFGRYVVSAKHECGKLLGVDEIAKVECQGAAETIRLAGHRFVPPKFVLGRGERVEERAT